MSITGTARQEGRGILELIREIGIVPVVVMDRADDAVPVARALVEAGLPCAEVTLRTPAALEALRRMAAAHPTMLVGAGTVLTPRQVDEARDAGARFIVSPGIDPAVVDRCLDRGIPVFPGVCTPTEIAVGIGRGLTTLKFFPAEPAGGVPYLRAISAPYPSVEFIPTGGIDASHLASYLGLNQVVACGGSWMVAREWIRAGEFDRISREAADAVRAARESRPAG